MLPFRQKRKGEEAILFSKSREKLAAGEVGWAPFLLTARPTWDGPHWGGLSSRLCPEGSGWRDSVVRSMALQVEPR